MGVVGLGAGGHAKVVIDILLLDEGCQVVGLVDQDQALWNTNVLGITVLGDDSLLGELRQQGVGHAFIGLGSVGDTEPRRLLYQKARDLGFEIIDVIHRQAIVSPFAQIGRGPTIMAGAVINAAAQLGDNVIVNTGAIVEHDCIIGNHVHIATGARLASTVAVGDGAHIGAGATVLQCVSIGQGAIVGAGAMVIRDVAPWTMVVGVPARVLRIRKPDTSDRVTPSAKVAT